MLAGTCTLLFLVTVTSQLTYVTCIYFPRYIRLKGLSNKPHPEEIEHYPHRVAIVDNNNFFICSATIIGDIWAITSAQCVYKKKNITIRAGSSCWAFRGTLHNVTNIIIHPDYRFTDPPNATHYNDLAILKVHKPFNEMKNAIPIQISTKEATEGCQGRLSSWGRHKTPEGNYQWSNLVIIDADTIHRRLCKSKVVPELTRGMMCYREKSINYFPPDRGSAYEVHGKLAGIRSFGWEPYNSRSFNVVTNVIFYKVWINSVMNRCRRATKQLPGTQLKESSELDSLDERDHRNVTLPESNTTRRSFAEYLQNFGLTFAPYGAKMMFV